MNLKPTDRKILKVTSAQPNSVQMRELVNAG